MQTLYLHGINTYCALVAFLPSLKQLAAVIVVSGNQSHIAYTAAVAKSTTNRLVSQKLCFAHSCLTIALSKMGFRAAICTQRQHRIFVSK